MTTKRISIALLSIFVAVIAFAANKDLEEDITMVSYEQRWLDYNGTLALKNNSMFSFARELRWLSFFCFSSIFFI